MSNRALLVLVASVILCATLVSGDAHAKRKKSTPEERAKAVELARELETNPMSDEALEHRRWLIDFYERVPDITVLVCDVLGPFPKEDHLFFSFVLTQYMFSSGAFMIEHPDQAKDQVVVQTSGVEGALKVYEQFATAFSDHRLPFLDALLAKRADGSLGTYMKDAVPKGCK